MTKTPSMSASHWRSYYNFLRSNKPYRRFWLAGVVSQFGNWFNYIAIFVLLERLTGSGQAVSWFLIAKFLPTSILGPAAGIIADRLPRKTIMIGCDLLRVAVVLAFLLIQRPEHVWAVYFLALAQEALWTFADPARQASVPNLCKPEELNIANGLSGATWSILLAAGSALGGFVTAAAGWQAAIIIDSLTFLLSALLLCTIEIPSRAKTSERQKTKKSLPKKTWIDYTGITDLKEGASYVLKNKKVKALLLVKSGWAMSGGILVMLVVFGEQVLTNSSQGIGSGILYSCRGLGAAVGPILAWRMLGERSNEMMRGIAFSFFVSAVAYIFFSQTTTILWAAPLVFIGHIGGATQWVFSTTLLQRVVQDEFRGRVFAAEMALVTLTLCVSTFLTGFALEKGYAPKEVALALALLFLIPAIGWHLYLHKRRKENKHQKQKG